MGVGCLAFGVPAFAPAPSPHHGVKPCSISACPAFGRFASKVSPPSLPAWRPAASALSSSTWSTRPAIRRGRRVIWRHAPRGGGAEQRSAGAHRSLHACAGRRSRAGAPSRPAWRRGAALDHDRKYVRGGKPPRQPRRARPGRPVHRSVRSDPSPPGVPRAIRPCSLPSPTRWPPPGERCATRQPVRGRRRVDRGESGRRQNTSARVGVQPLWGSWQALQLTAFL